MLDIVRSEVSPNAALSMRGADGAIAASLDFALLSRQTHALAYIATQLGQLAAAAIEVQPDYELATRRLLQEPV